MDIHKNAKLTPQSRAAIVRRVLDQGQPPAAVAVAVGVCARTVRKWVVRYQAEGADGLRDRSSRPHRQPRALPAAVAAQVVALRRRRWSGAHIAATVHVSPATVSRILRRAGLQRLAALDPPPPVRRYEHPHPGDLLHLDIKKLGRFRRAGHRVTHDRRHTSPGAGWEYVHVCVDDHSRVAFSQIYPDETAASATAFLAAALAYYQYLGIQVRRVLTDNGGCYRSRAFNARCLTAGLRHRYTRPFTPRTNGKAERFIQTALREWAYAHVYHTSAERAAHLPPWIHRYNWHRPHASLKARPPISRIGLTGDNLLRFHI